MKTGIGMAAAVVVALLAPLPAHAGVADCGLLTNFASVTYQNTAGDPYSASYAVTFPIRVATPNLMVSKVASPTLQGAGGIVQFCISFQNLSFCASAIDVVVTDRVPDNMNFLPLGPNFYAWTNGPNNGTEQEQWNNAGTWTNGEPVTYANFSLRWGYPRLAPRESGVICFRASVL